MTILSPTAAVIIGRNEGDRLMACLESLSGRVGEIVYVDSGSTDGSVAQASAFGAHVIALDLTKPFTAARARNAGVAALIGRGARPDFIQFVDGDCQLHPDWIPAATTFLASHPQAAAASGRLREIAPEASIYNRLADAEWDTPIGEVRACGGIVMMRTVAFEDVGGFDGNLIAGEEPELCVRLRAAGWTIHRIDADMGWHDLAMTRFSQWWRRTIRGGFAAAQGAAMHGAAPERHKVRETARALLWGLLLPLAIVGGTLVTGWAIALALLWPLQVLRLRLRGSSWAHAGFMTLGKIPEAIGILGFMWDRVTRRRRGLIEYK